MASSGLFPGPNAALIGFTGFVGSNLLQHFPHYRATFNSKNIHTIQDEINARGPFDVIVCAGAPGFKLGANSLGQTLEGGKYDDTEAMDRLIEDLDRINVQESEKKTLFVLISTISVYSVCSLAESQVLEKKNLAENGRYYSDVADIHELTEERDVWTRPGPLSDGGLSDSVYGRNRARLEAFVKEKFNNYLLIRLPGIFGSNMRKNYIFDLLTKSPWRHKINLNSYHQWYPLSRLTSDIRAVIDEKLSVVNLFPEPIKTQRIVEEIFSEQLIEVPNMRKSEEAFWDDVRTKHVALWEDGKSTDDGGYRMSAEESLRELRAFKAAF